MVIYSISVSVDGFINDRQGAFDWGAPGKELFRFHTELVRTLGVQLMGRRLYEVMLAWESDPALRQTEDNAAFAEVWNALPKVVFSRTLTTVQGNARLARGSVADEFAAAVASTDKQVAIGGAGLAAEAFASGLIDDVRLFRYPVVVGGGTPALPPVSGRIRLDLLETRQFEGGVLFERYGLARHDDGQGPG